MDITTYVSSNRDKAFLVGDYNSYRSQLSRQILSLRKRLGRATPKNAKTPAKIPITASDVGQNKALVWLILLQAERAWAQAMHMKSIHAENTAGKGLSGPTRSHIISRLNKASKYANNLVDILRDQNASGASDVDLLEAQAYALCHMGSEEFEKHASHRYSDTEAQKAAWRKCLEYFSEAHVIYSALVYSSQKDLFKEVLASNVDPSIRYAAYQSRLSRTIPVSTVAKQYFRKREQSQLLAAIETIQPSPLSEAVTSISASKEGTTTEPIPTTMTWRGRVAAITDASIGQALAATSLAASSLTDFMSTTPNASAATIASQYDPVLTAAQDTTDAVRRALSDLAKEGIPESDSRTQDLRVCDLAANHALISWRIGRNRVLIGREDDGLTFALSQSPPLRTARASKKQTTNADGDINLATAPRPKPETKTHALSRLRARVVLYDTTLQSLDAISAQRGASRDSGFVAELGAQRAYFQALRALNLGYSHSLLSSHREALALFARANSLLATIAPADLASQDTGSDAATPPDLSISPAQLSTAQSHLASLVTRQRGLVALHQTLSDAASKALPTLVSANQPPLSDRLATTFPPLGVFPLEMLQSNIVRYPPRLEAVPVKPIFLDLAWNYIDYPGTSGREEAEGGVDGVDGVAKKVADGVGAAVGGVVEKVVGDEDKRKAEDTGKKRGWFGFGRG